MSLTYADCISEDTLPEFDVFYLSYPFFVTQLLLDFKCPIDL